MAGIDDERAATNEVSIGIELGDLIVTRTPGIWEHHVPQRLS
jgi:hypothetical protein